MKENYYTRNPTQNWKIAEDVEHIFLSNDKKKQIWHRIVNKIEAIKPIEIVKSNIIKPYIRHNN
jgi:outer membrane lipopolysaccharide assembly protein LptE/RlpB